MRSFFGLLLALCLASPPAWADEASDFSPVTTGGNQVDGLTLPADMKVPADAGLIKITARADYPVKFTVLGSVPGVKAEAAGKSVVVSIPPIVDAEIVVLACTVNIKKSADGKIASAAPSEFARTNILVVKAANQPPEPEPKPEPPPKPSPKLAGKGYVTLIHDPQAATAEIAAVLNSAAVRKLPNTAVRVVDIHDPILKRKNLADKITQTPWLIVQNVRGEIVASQALPETETALLALLQSLRGQ